MKMDAYKDSNYLNFKVWYAEANQSQDQIPVHESTQICQCSRSRSPVGIIGRRKNHIYGLLEVRFPNNHPF